jgi:hypothetical protein
MKAKFVYENVHFERGQDPKDSMRIGRSVKIRELIEKEAWEGRAIDLSSYNWDYEYVNFSGYDGYIVHIKEPLMDLPYVGIIPGLWVTSYEESPELILLEFRFYMERSKPFI